MEWIGGEFDPEEFDLDEVNTALLSIKPTHRSRKSKIELESEEVDDEVDNIMPSAKGEKAVADALAEWIKNLGQEQSETLESLPLRRDVLTFLDYLSKTRTVGTQFTGNLPLKAIKAICEKFVHPPALEETISGHTFRVHSEDEVWPLVFVHHLAFDAALVTGGQAQTWKVLPEGQQLFPQLPAPVQIFFLFMHWWAQEDWKIVYPVSGLAGGLPTGFKEQTLACLLELPVRENVSADVFADCLIAQSGLEWHAPDQRLAQRIMRHVIERTVVHPMGSFGILEYEYGKENIAGSDFSKLETVRLTKAGKGMLD